MIWSLIEDAKVIYSSINDIFLWHFLFSSVRNVTDFTTKKKKTAPEKDQQHNKSANKIKRNDKNSLNSVCE